MSVTSHAIKLAQISDTHLLDSPEDILHGINPYRRLSRVFDYVKSKNYDLIILSGDLADRGSPNAYQHLLDLLKKISTPILIFSGNHDDAHQLNTIFSNQKQYLWLPDEPVIFENWQLLTVNTVLPGKTHGFINEEAAACLMKQMQRITDKNIALFMHHNPLLTGVEKVDAYGVHNFEKLRDILTLNVKLIAYGHIHHDLHQWDRWITYVGCPSTAFQINEAGEIDVGYYGLKEYMLDGDLIQIKPIWFTEV